MTPPKTTEQFQARMLRAQGRSLRTIAAELGVAFSSVSAWTRDIEPPGEPAEPPDHAPTLEAVPVARCTKCKQVLPVSGFHKGGTWCKDCRREYIRSRGDLHRQQTYAARDKRRAIAQEYMLTLLRRGACADCGLADPLVLEFDHVGTKTAEICILVREGYRLERIEKEVAECELVCANCHRRRTARRANSWRLDPQVRAAACTRPLQRRNLLFLVAYLATVSCTDCGEPDPVVLEFDHVGDKRGNVVQLVWSEHSIASIQREIDECEIRCVNCHRRRTIRGQPNHLRHHLIEPP